MLYIALTTCISSILVGCQVESVGKSEISVDEDGNIIGVVAVCEGKVDGVLLVPEGGKIADGRWQYISAHGASASFVLTEPGPEWETIVPFTGELDPGTQYLFYGWTDDNSSSTDSVGFTQDQIDTLEPWTVLYSEEHETVSDYLKHACDDWN